MKQPKKLTRNQKELVARRGLNWKDWMFVDGCDDYFRIMNKKLGTIKFISKEN